MITLLFGENSFEIESALSAIINKFDGRVENVKSDELTVSQLPDIFMGVSLFSEKRLVVIRRLSENRLIWPILGDWLDRISDDINLVLIESKIDKRSATYKTLKEKADVREFLPWSDRDFIKAEKWVIDWVKKNNVSLDAKNAKNLVRRVGADQWLLHHALEKLSLVDEINANVIDEIIEPNLTENVFELFETAVKGDLKKTKTMLDTLNQTEDVYRLSSLMFSQAFQMATISVAPEGANPSKDFGIHPYVASKLDSLAKMIGRNGVKKVILEFARADESMKTSRSDPWLILANALFKIAKDLKEK